MNNQLAQNDPKLGFIVVKNERLSNLASESIDLLYQPIIGSAATALVRLLWRYSDEQRVDYKQRSHFDLFTFLQIDFRRFKQLRIKLEGAGLLKTFVQPTDSKPVMIYQLVVPLSNRQFFDDDLLSLALLENVGTEIYQRLAQKLLIKPFETENAEEITQDFLDSFQIDADQLTDQPTTISDLKQTYALNQPLDNVGAHVSHPVADANFDFQLLLDILNKSYVRIDQVKKYYQLFLNEHLLYGIDELQLSKLIVRATNINNNVFDPNKLKELVSNMYTAPKRARVQPQSTPEQPSNQDGEQLSSAERSLINTVNQYAPMKFLEQLKKKQNGFVANSETKIVSQMLDRNIMSTGALNMLIYHTLIDSGKPQIYESFFTRVANEWVQKYNVQTAEDAMRAIKAYNRKKAETQSNPGGSSGGYRNRKPVQLPDPDWMRDDYKPNVPKVTEADRREVQEMLKKFKHED